MSTIIKEEIHESLKSAFLEYAKEVIEDRALPDVRDGLKPVHRRILFAMMVLDLFPEKQRRKCARIVGDTIGKYHPHGDVAAYDALVRMAQDFSLRYPLIDPQGNFGAIDGTGHAAMRYTESKLSVYGNELLRGTNDKTVLYQPNYDEQEIEPTVLAGAFPNLLVNGSSGIAVGMATNIPPHHLGTMIDAIIYTFYNPSCSIDELVNIIKGPDFPTGGIVSGDVKTFYRTGRGSVKIRSKYRIDKGTKNRDIIYFTEIPYTKRTDKLLEKMQEVLSDHPQVVDVRDEGGKEISLVVECKRDAGLEVLDILFDKTELASEFRMHNLVLVNDVPKTLNLKETITYYIQHQTKVLRQQIQLRIEKLKKEIHLLEGWRIVLEKDIDKAIEIIRGATNKDSAKTELESYFGLSDVQSESIVNYRLYRLTLDEMDKVLRDLASKEAELKESEELLASPVLMRDMIRDNLLEMKKKFDDDRKSKIV